jgi:hypothetical protein
MGEIGLSGCAYSHELDSPTASIDTWDSPFSVFDSRESEVVTGAHSCPIVHMGIDSDAPTWSSVCNISFLGAWIEAVKPGFSCSSSSTLPEPRGMKIGASALSNVT